MTRKPYIESLICAPQSRGGGYGCHAVIDNSLNRIFRALSWLFAAASAFVCSAIGLVLGATRRVAFPPSVLLLPVVWQISPAFTPYTLHFTPYLPPISIGSSSGPDRNLIGTSQKDYRDILKGYIGDI